MTSTTNKRGRTSRERSATGTTTQEPNIRKGGKLAPTPVVPQDSGPLTKASLELLGVEQLPTEKPDFEQPGVSKDVLIAQWLTEWITQGLASGQLHTNHLLPRKADIAVYLDVSVGTVQNAIRYVEDEGHVESKQRIGTVLRNVDGGGESRMRKQTSKRDQAVVAIQQFIASRGLQPGEAMPSARVIAKVIGSAPNTTRLALEYLSATGILESQGVRGNKANWYVQQVPDVPKGAVGLPAIESETLIDHVERDLKALINERYEPGDKLPSHLELADQFRVSIKTIHDAMRRLGEQGIVQSKRGRYGTYVARLPQTGPSAEDEALFVAVEEQTNDAMADQLQAVMPEQSFYNYERVESHLKALIARHYQVDDRLPPMNRLAEDLNVSSNTVRKALQNLAKEGFVMLSRGRYGGTFVTKLPPRKTSPTPGVAWVSLNPETAKSYNKPKP